MQCTVARSLGGRLRRAARAAYRNLTKGRALQWRNLSTEERILLCAVYLAYHAISNRNFLNLATSHVFSTTKKALRTKSVFKVNKRRRKFIIAKFKADPKTGLAILRRNLITVCKQGHSEQLDRYLQAAIKLQVKLDAVAYPPTLDTSTVLEGIPNYIPDGFSDLGKDKNPDPWARQREKIGVNKTTLLLDDKLFTSLKEIVIAASKASDSTAAKTMLVTEAASWTYKNIEYSEGAIAGHASRPATVGVAEVAAKGAGVCRHQALIGALILQTLGIEVRLFKCLYNGHPHAALMIRKEGKWYLLDQTNPVQNTPTFVPYMVKIHSSTSPAGTVIHEGTLRKYTIPDHPNYYRVLPPERLC